MPPWRYDRRRMGQSVSVIERHSTRGGHVRYELNRVLTGTGHEVYTSDVAVEGERPPDVLARRLFEHGGIEKVHVNGNVVTVTPERGGTVDGVKEIIEDLYTYYLPGVPVPSLEAPAEDVPAES